jgi:hypothetical protein
VYALAKANMRLRSRRDADGNIIHGEHYTSSHSSLERVHLSYCTNLTLMVGLYATQIRFSLPLTLPRASFGFLTRVLA